MRVYRDVVRVDRARYRSEKLLDGKVLPEHPIKIVRPAKTALFRSIHRRNSASIAPTKTFGGGRKCFEGLFELFSPENLRAIIPMAVSMLKHTAPLASAGYSLNRLPAIANTATRGNDVAAGAHELVMPGHARLGIVGGRGVHVTQSSVIRRSCVELLDQTGKPGTAHQARGPGGQMIIFGGFLLCGMRDRESLRRGGYRLGGRLLRLLGLGGRATVEFNLAACRACQVSKGAGVRPVVLIYVTNELPSLFRLSCVRYRPRYRAQWTLSPACL